MLKSARWTGDLPAMGLDKPSEAACIRILTSAMIYKLRTLPPTETEWIDTAAPAGKAFYRVGRK